MALISCHECSKEISSEANACPNCGAAPKKPEKHGVSGLGIGAMAIAFLLLVVVVIANFGGNPQRAQDRSIIEQCWKDYERKSLAAGTKQFLATTCESLEDKFTAKYGHKP